MRFVTLWLLLVGTVGVKGAKLHSQSCELSVTHPDNSGEAGAEGHQPKDKHLVLFNSAGRLNCYRS
jgi:hypothetical protein